MLESSNFIISKNSVYCFPWNDSFIVHFLEEYLPNTQVCITAFSVSHLSSKRSVCAKIGNSNVQTFFLKTTIVLDVQQKCFMGIFISSPRMLQSRVLKGQDLIKWEAVTASSRTFLHELFFFNCMWWWRIQWWIIHFGTIAELC